AKKAEEERIAEEKRIAEEEARKAEEARIAEEKRIAEEEAKKAEEERIAEEKRIAEEEARKAEEARIAEEKRIAEEEAKKAEEERIAEEKRIAEEEARKAEEARIAEEKRIAEEEAKKAEKTMQVIREIAEKEAEEVKTAELAQTNEADSPPASADDKPMNKNLVAAGICLLFIIALILNASIANSKKFYIQETSQGVEILKGNFSPISKTRIALLKGADISGKTEEVYTKNQVLPIPFHFYLDKADELLKTPNNTAFPKALDLVNKAALYASTVQDKELILAYQDSIIKALNGKDDTPVTIPAREAPVSPDAKTKAAEASQN
ncbi:MAG: hypothetical protein R6V54_05915, partial [Desulfobacteraceae bacterium]